MLILLVSFLAIISILSARQKYYNFLGAILPILLYSLIEILFPIPGFANNLFWMATASLGSFCLGNAFKTNLKGIFLFAVVISAFLYFTTNQIPIVLLFGGFNYLIQLGTIIKYFLSNYEGKLNYEQLLFAIFCFGGIGSLLGVVIWSYQLVLIYLLFYYAALILIILFRERIERARDFFFP